MPLPVAFARAVLLCVAVLLAQVARAEIVSYRFTLTVDRVSVDLTQCGRTGFSGLGGFDCDAAAGDRFVGQFQLADGTDSLADGIYSFLPLTSWSIEIGNVDWDINDPGSDFRGFRDGAYCGAAGVGLGASSPGMRVSSGRVIGFCGGVYGDGDDPFIDFEYLYGPGRFSAFDGINSLDGSYTIEPVPEPATIALVSAALIGVAATRRRKLAISAC